MFCGNCGTKNIEGGKFCQSCGNSISSIQEVDVMQSGLDQDHRLSKKLKTSIEQLQEAKNLKPNKKNITQPELYQNNRISEKLQTSHKQPPKPSLPVNPNQYKQKKYWVISSPIIVFITTLILWSAVSSHTSPLSDLLSALVPFVIGVTVIIGIPTGILMGIFFHRKEKQESLLLYDERSGLGDESIIPKEIKGWNWGAFGLSIIWAPYHGIWWGTLVMFIPFLNIIYPFVLGSTGSELAWKKYKWKSVEDFKRSRRKWGIAWVIILFCVILPLSILSAILEVAITN